MPDAGPPRRHMSGHQGHNYIDIQCPSAGVDQPVAIERVTTLAGPNVQGIAQGKICRGAADLKQKIACRAVPSVIAG